MLHNYYLSCNEGKVIIWTGNKKEVFNSLEEADAAYGEVRVYPPTEEEDEDGNLTYTFEVVDEEEERAEIQLQRSLLAQEYCGW